jgi:hypothetical protein
MAANKEKVDIRRSDQFQEVDDELTRAMAELDSTIERVSLIFQSDSDLPELERALEAVGSTEAVVEAETPETPEAPEKQTDQSESEQ